MIVGPQDRVHQRLNLLFQQGKGVFSKLTSSEAPYRFVDWQLDKAHRRCLYYEFDANDPTADDHEKRVPVEELVAAIGACATHGFFDRALFAKSCPVAKSAGDCGFAVTGRCLELLEVAEYAPDKHFFKLTNEARAKLLTALD
jgi:hypothetical protein